MPDMENRTNGGQANPAEDDMIEDIPAAAVKKVAPAKPASGAAAVKSGATKTAAKPASSAAAGKSGGTKAVAKPASSAKATNRSEAKTAALDTQTGEKASKAGRLLGGLIGTGRTEKEKPEKKPLSKKAALRRKKRIRRYIRRTILSIITILAVVVFGVYMVLFTVFHGPSPTASDLLVNTVLETSALKFVPYLYFSAEEVDEIVARNAIEVPDEATDPSLVVIDRTPKANADGTVEEEKDIELVEVSGETYHGYMMIVKDPSRVTLAVSSPDFSSEYGKYLDEMAEENGAIAAINAGGFEDVGGGGRGGKPLGIVVKDGQVLNSRTSDECDIVIGFDQNDRLIVGKMNAKEAMEAGLRDAASFNPILVLNGEPAEVRGSSSGLNPRTAIGQRADGAVLLLVIDGRQVNSLGASLADLIDVMMQFGAVNAANLDGGSSSKMYYQGEFVNDGVALTGSRRLPTAFIVK